MYYTPAKNYESWLTIDKVVAIITRLTFLAHPVQRIPVLCRKYMLHLVYSVVSMLNLFTNSIKTTNNSFPNYLHVVIPGNVCWLNNKYKCTVDQEL